MPPPSIAAPHPFKLILPRRSSRLAARCQRGLRSLLSDLGVCSPPMVAVSDYHVHRDRLVRSEALVILLTEMTFSLPCERLGVVRVPPRWEGRARFLCAHDWMLLDVYDPPVWLSQRLVQDAFTDGLYVGARGRVLGLWHLHAQPEGRIAVLREHPWKPTRELERELDPAAGDDLRLHAQVVAYKGPNVTTLDC